MPPCLPPLNALLGPGGGVVFDMDGLLIDTETLAKTAWQRVAREKCFELSDELFLLMVGRSTRDCAVLLRDRFGPDLPFEEVHRAVHNLVEEHIAAQGVPLKPGAREIVRYFHESHIPLAVATSTAQPKASCRLEEAGLLRFFSAVVAGNEVTSGKPAPDIYLEAVRRLGVDPAKSIAFEDSFAGIRSAHAAGVRVIMVPDLLPPTAEIRALAFHVATSLVEAQAQLKL